MRLLITTAAACVAMSAQNGPELLGWRLSTDSVCSAATKGVAACRLDPVPANEAGWRKALAAAARSGVSVVVAPATANLALADKAGADENVTVAVMASNQPEAALKAVSPYGKHVGLWADPAAWDKSGTRPLAAIYMLRERLAGGTLTPGPVSEEFVKEAYRLDLKHRTVSRDGKPLESLTDKEFSLAIFLFQNLGRLLSRGHLLEAIWGLNATIPTRTLDTHISRLRKKLELYPANGFRLVPAYNYGYRLDRVERVS